jgi:ADP-ribosylglycohydrolase
MLSAMLCVVVFLSWTPGKKMIKISEAEYLDKVYASWLGQIIGNIYGLPHENKYIDEPGPENFPYGYGRNLNYLKEVNGAFSDDDTDFEYMYLLAMEKYGPEPTYAQLTESWKYHVRERVWLANRAALAAMQYGYSPPVTGMKAYNPHWFQIDPQLVNEIWAVTSPGMIHYAAEKSGWAARITDDDWGIEPTIHYGAMYAAAFFESDVYKLIDIGTKALPKGSRFARTVEDMKRLYRKYPADWKQARKEMAQKYYHKESEDTKTIWNANLNGACGILALLYGEGNFQKTLDLACAMGFDADNQAATMSGLLGIVVGTDGLPDDLLNPIKGWEKPFNDFYKNVTRYDMPDASLKDMAERMVKQAEKIILKQGGEKVVENGDAYYLINANAKFIAPLEFPFAPMPAIEAGQPVDYSFLVSGGKPPYQWTVLEGAFPAGITFKNGKISGVTEAAGIYPVTLQVEQNDKKVSRGFELVVRSKNLAQNAKKILTNVNQTNVEKRDSMWLTVGRSLYADRVDVIRDGKRLGDGSTFYSISEDPKLKVHYFGYEWDTPQTIGLVDLHTGSVEENGGWFTSLNVEYQDEKGKWRPVKDLSVKPPLMPGKERFNKPHFVEYMLAFQPVKTKAIRVIGDAGAVKHWTGIFTYFTSLTELSVHEPLPSGK